MIRSLTAAALVMCASAAHAQCRPGDLLVGEDENNYHCRSRAQYEGSAAQQAGLRYCTARRVVAADQNAIRELGFALDAERFEMFEGVAREQKHELERRVFNALLDSGLDATGALVNSARSLNPWNVNNAVRMLNDKGFGHPAVVAALRRVAATKDKPAMAAAYRDFERSVRAYKEGWNTAVGVSEDQKNAELRMLVGALKTMQGNPELGLAVTAAELGESLAYLVYIGRNVNELTESTDEKLARLATLTQRLKDHVRDVRAHRTAWRSAMGIRAGEPSCG